jgi:hypothetical protein
MKESELEPRDRPESESGLVVSFPNCVEAIRGRPSMERIDLYSFYQIANGIHPLAELSERELPAAALFFPLVNARGSLTILLGPDAPVKIELSRQAAHDLLNSMSIIEAKYFRDQNGDFSFPDAATIAGQWEVHGLKENLKTFEAVFRAEMQNSATYRVPKRGIYNIGDLVDRAAEAFSDTLRPHIGKVALDEYQQAGRCYAFGLYTASGYHSCRAAEGVLRAYYRMFTGKSDSGDETWGQLLNALTGENSGKKDAKPKEALAPVKTLDQIRHLKDFNRNPISHLRSVLEEKDADELLSRAKVVIMAMASDMMEKREAVEPTLSLVPPDDEKAA